MDINEFKIPVPWGHVAVKAWGNEADTPILVIHGLGDNAGSYDRLMPYLPASFYYICIDLPSHGKSSPYPPHLLISALDVLLTFKIVVNYFDRKKFILMGHSWGGHIAVLFTQLYPEYVLKLILFDAFYLYPVNNFKDYLVDKFDMLIRTNENIAKNKQPTYTFEEAVVKLIESRMWSELFEESAEVLVKRSLVPTENERYYFATDPRLKAYINPIFDLDFALKLIKKYPVTCPVLFVYASESKVQHSLFKEIIKELRKHNKMCVIREVTGSHDVHNNSPNAVGPIVSNFLIHVKSKM